MTYAALNSLKLTLNQILMHPDRYSIPDHKQHIESLLEKLGYLLEFLEGSFSQKSDQKITRLEKRISDAACEAEDIIDLHLSAECEEEGEEEEEEVTTDTKNSVNCSSFWFMLKNCLLPLFTVLIKTENRELHCHEKEIRRQVLKRKSGEFQNIVEEINSITEEVLNLKNKIGSDHVMEEMDSVMEGTRETKNKFIPDDNLKRHCDYSAAASSKLASSGNNFMVGVEDLFVEIKDQLTGSESNLKVVSIVGMGGTGKTTLATNFQTDLSIVDHFDIRAWATVSQSYSTRNVLLDILDSMKMLTDEIRQESDCKLGHYLYKTLKDMRYLITIDDIWDTDAWDDVKLMLPDDNNGSRIMLTTRLNDVAAYASSSGYIHQMSLLSADKSWILLHAKVFGKGPCPVDLKELGRKIAKNCRGLPLSIVVIGGLLSKVNLTQEMWGDIADNVSSIVTSHSMEILKLSYNYLPPHLKACFLYMGVFPEDHEISVSKLTKLWVAEGFLKEVQFQSLEEVAKSCLEELIDRNLIFISKNSSVDKVKRCTVHDLLRELCVKEANKEKFLHVTSRYGNVFSKISHGQNHIGMHPTKIMNHALSISPSISFARSFICMEKKYFPSTLFPRFRLLRVLDAAQVNFLIFPFEILKLLHLRYVAFKYKGEIPASISKLWNLQTLIIHQNFCLFEKRTETWLPLEIWMMPHLRHIHFAHTYYLDPTGVSLDFDGKHIVLKDLQSLSGICNLRLTADLLRRIPSIKKLEMSYDIRCKEKGWSYYHFGNLVNLNQLKKLKISVAPETKWKFKSIPRKFNFVFPRTLQMLSLSGCQIPWSDMELVGSLPNLQVLKLKDHACRGTEWEPNEGEFCQLKVLVIEETDLKYWRADYDPFPSLERLVLEYCYNLVEIPSWMGESPTLTTIELYNSNESTWASAQEILQSQRSLENNDFQVVVHHMRRKKSAVSNLDGRACHGKQKISLNA